MSGLLIGSVVVAAVSAAGAIMNRRG